MAKILFAPDSYKGALRSPDVAAALAEGWHSRRPDDELVLLPLADGGEGTCDAVTAAAGGVLLTLESHDALMRPIRAQAGLTRKFAVLETAAANGIELLTKEELDPMRATSFGAGELLAQLVRRGCREILIGIGGSATVDGGAGMLQALGAKFFDASGKELPPGANGSALSRIERFDLSALPPQLKECKLRVACDVVNPLTGPQGAAAVFGPQKGATPEMIPQLDSALHHWASLWHSEGDAPGDGAAGGLGFLLRQVLGAEIVSGAELVMHYTGFEKALAGASLVLTGEGCSDTQTACGKLCQRVALRARQSGVPTVLFSGALRGDPAEWGKDFLAVLSIASGPGSLEQAMADTERNLFRAGANAAGFFNCKNKV